MSLRWDDAARTLALSVRDLVSEGAPRGHLQLEVVQRRSSRAAQGQAVHQEWQRARAAADPEYRAEVRVLEHIAVEAWTVALHGRVDGLTREGDRAVVEEVKSTALDAARLLGTSAEDWPQHTAQLEVYLWMLAREGVDRPVGRLVLVSIADGCRHVLGVELDADRVEAWVRARLDELVRARELRIAWMASRRSRVVPRPHAEWRPGQRAIAEAVEWGLEAGHQVLVEAPTGLGKTAAVLTGALRFALAHDKQVFWATSRTTQQPVLRATARRLMDAGLELRSVLLTAKEKICLNEVVACQPDACPFAEGYYDKLRALDLVQRVATCGVADRPVLEAAGHAHRVCPYELSLDVSEHTDLVVGDVNYAFEPSVHLRRHFGDTAGDWVVVVDEAHQLVERARGWGSPRLSARAAVEAAEWLGAQDAGLAPFAELARDVAREVDRQAAMADGPRRRGEAVVELELEPLAALAERVDAVGLDYALLQAGRVRGRGEDPWLDTARAVLRFAQAAAVAGDETVALAHTAPDRAELRLLCLDPAPALGPRLARLGGLVGASATLSPVGFYRDLLGLDADRLDVVRVPSPFPVEHRRVLVAPRVSTMYRDRAAHAGATAALMARCIEAVDGNVAAYFPSFEMLEDIAGRWELDGRELLQQGRAMREEERADWLARLGAAGPPVVLAAVLGGIFAEGIDLPAGALSAVLVAGPALPPVGLERDLLRNYYEERFGEGFRYASLIPGMTRVVQAAGRLIRRPEDRGVIVLIGRRFRWRDVRDLLPDDWTPEIAADPSADLARFAEGA